MVGTNLPSQYEPYSFTLTIKIVGFGFFIVITLLSEALKDKSVSFGLVHNFLNFSTKYLLEAFLMLKIVLLNFSCILVLYSLL